MYPDLIEPRTGPLDAIRGLDVFVLADLENLRYGARDLGFALDLAAIPKLLRGVAKSCALHACESEWPDRMKARAAELTTGGWTAHLKPIARVPTRDGGRVSANADNLLLLKCGDLVSRARARCVVVASGDGDLVQDIAHYVRTKRGQVRRVFTLSLPGSTSHRLNAAHNPLIQGNLEIGLDCLTPLSRRPGGAP